MVLHFLWPRNRLSWTPIVKLSVVIVARNDDYGGGFQARLLRTITRLLSELDRIHASAEVIIVQWNPLPTEPLLEDRLRAAGKFSTPLWVITVDGQTHQRIQGSEKSPVMEYMAKNVGIRRASGDYILSTNADILLNANIVSFMTNAALDPHTIYRSNRFDLPSDIPAYITDQHVISWCDQHWSRMLAYWGPVERGDILAAAKHKLASWLLPIRGGAKKYPHVLASGDFTLMHRNQWWALRGYKEIAQFAYLDGLLVYSALSIGLRQVILGKKMRIYHQYHARAEQKDRTALGVNEVLESGKDAIRDKVVLIYNDSSWGLADVSLRSVLALGESTGV